jgi:hypothetical protein
MGSRGSHASAARGNPAQAVQRNRDFLQRYFSDRSIWVHTEHGGHLLLRQFESLAKRVQRHFGRLSAYDSTTRC